jgi:2,3-dihydroxybenzoate decarboxylase
MEARTMVKKIALEEHFMMPELAGYFASTKANISPTLFDKAIETLSDFGDRRLSAMSSAGVERAILSVAGPGVLAEAANSIAIRLARV